MSHVLTVTTREPFDPERLGLADLRWDQDGGTFQLWREKVGARVITVNVADGEVTVRIPVLASAEDVGLAVAVATGFGVPVDVE